jgi:hypothetical protein
MADPKRGAGEPPHEGNGEGDPEEKQQKIEQLISRQSDALMRLDKLIIKLEANVRAADVVVAEEKNSIIKVKDLIPLEVVVWSGTLYQIKLTKQLEWGDI